MIQNAPDLITAIRDRFAHVDTCPFQGDRIFFENAGGALTLKSVVETSGFYAITRFKYSWQYQDYRRYPS